MFGTVKLVDPVNNNVRESYKFRNIEFEGPKRNWDVDNKVKRSSRRIDTIEFFYCNNFYLLLKPISQIRKGENMIMMQLKTL